MKIYVISGGPGTGKTSVINELGKEFKILKEAARELGDKDSRFKGKSVKEIRMKEFDYYIFIDFSENLIGCSIIEKEKLKELLPKISRFRHYKEAKNRKLYIKNVNKTIKRDNIKSSFLRLKIKKMYKNMEIYLEVLEFLKKHENCIIFISVDDRQYSTFRKIVNIVDGENVIVKRESELIKGTPEYQASLVLDNLLNIERLRK